MMQVTRKGVLWTAIIVAVLSWMIWGCERRNRDKVKQETVKVSETRGDIPVDVSDPDRAPRLDTLAPAVGSVGVLEMAGDTSTYRISYSLSKPPRLGDTVQVRLGRDSLSPTSPRYIATAKLTTQQGTASLKMPKIFGAVTRNYACVRLLAKTINIAEKCEPKWATNYPAKPDTLPPVIDSVKVDSALALSYVRAIRLTKDSLPVQFCMFYKFKDGKVRLDAGQLQSKGCDQLYKMFPVTQQFARLRGGHIIDAHYKVHIDAPAKTITVELVRGP